MTKNNKIMVYLKKIIRKLNKCIENENRRKYIKLEVISQCFTTGYFK